MRLDPYLTPYADVNGANGLNVRDGSVRLLGAVRNLGGLELGNGSSAQTPQAQRQEKKQKNRPSSEMTLCVAHVVTRNVKGRRTEPLPEQGLGSRMYKDLFQLHDKNAENPMKNWANDRVRDILPRKVRNRPVGTWKPLTARAPGTRNLRGDPACTQQLRWR